MSLTALFKKINAPLANSRWSWGSVRPDGSIVLRVWQDRKERIDDKLYILIAHKEDSNGSDTSRGYKERLANIEAIKAGAKCLMVMCLAVDTEATPRVIKSFNKKDIFVGGDVLVQDGDTYVELVGRQAVRELS